MPNANASHHLQVLYAMLRMGMEDLSLDDLLDRLLGEILNTPWMRLAPKGGIFLVEGETPALYLKAQRNLASPLLGSCARVEFGHCLCGRAAQGSEIVYAAHVDHRHETRYDGILPHGHYVAPIHASSGELLGVLVLYLEAGHVRNDEEISFLQAITSTLASIIERKRNEEALCCYHADLESQVLARTVELRAEIAGHTKTQASLQESETRIRHIIDSAMDAVIAMDRQGRVTEWNPTAERLFGWSRAEMLGQDLAEHIIPAEFRQAHNHGLRRYFDEGSSRVLHQRIEVTALRRDGSRFPAEASVSPFLTASGETQFSAFLRDITERRRMERLKDEFVSTVSHELRTPLTSIRGALGLVHGSMSSALPDKARQMIGIAHKNSERLVLLINDLLDIQKIETGRMEFKAVPTPLTGLMEQAIEANRDYAQQFGVALMLENACEEGVSLFVDANRFMQVMANILSNAAKFSPPHGEVRIGVSCRDEGRHDGGGGVVSIAVQDRGPGIPESFRGRVFEKFSQADATTTRVKGGTGLGLSISKALVERMGGSIAFACPPQGGTIFTVELPRYQPESALPESHDHGIPLLIVEDDPDIAVILKSLLKNHGYAAHIATSAEEALARLDERPYAAMLLDIMLPGQDGFGLLRHLRSDARFWQLPVVVVSALPEDRDRLEEFGSTALVDWITKPIDAPRLLAAVATGTRAWNSERPRILHVEDDPDVRQIVRSVLEAQAEVVNAVSLAEARVLLAEERFDLLLLDLALPDGPGHLLLHELERYQTRPPVLLFSGHEPPAGMRALFTQVLTKSRTTNQQLIDTVRALTRCAVSPPPA